jgi:hypothetical protein
MPDIPDDGDLEAREAPLVCANRQYIEQALRGMRKVRLAGADHGHMRFHVIDQELGHTRLRVANDEHVRVHRLQRINGVEHALALGARTRVQIQVEHVGAQAPAGQVERSSRAGAGLEK